MTLADAWDEGARAMARVLGAVPGGVLAENPYRRDAADELSLLGQEIEQIPVVSNPDGTVDHECCASGSCEVCRR